MRIFCFISRFFVSLQGIFVKIIRKLIFYNFGIDFYMRIGIFDRSKKSNDLYQNESNKKNNIIEIQKERIII